MKISRIDLSRGKEHDHPDIKTDGTYYIARPLGKRGALWFGTFEQLWFGLSFNCNFGACGHIQFDAPGYNRSKWVDLWEVEGLK
jgi:hypothetical protein